MGLSCPGCNLASKGSGSPGCTIASQGSVSPGSTTIADCSVSPGCISSGGSEERGKEGGGGALRLLEGVLAGGVGLEADGVGEILEADGEVMNGNEEGMVSIIGGVDGEGEVDGEGWVVANGGAGGWGGGWEGLGGGGGAGGAGAASPDIFCLHDFNYSELALSPPPHPSTSWPPSRQRGFQLYKNDVIPNKIFLR